MDKEGLIAPPLSAENINIQSFAIINENIIIQSSAISAAILETTSPKAKCETIHHPKFEFQYVIIQSFIFTALASVANISQVSSQFRYSSLTQLQILTQNPRRGSHLSVWYSWFIIRFGYLWFSVRSTRMSLLFLELSFTHELVSNPFLNLELAQSVRSHRRPCPTQ